MKINSEEEMLEFGQDMAKKLTLPAVIELIGDVGAGKTTFTRGLAQGLGISEPVTSPSFTISKRYNFPGGELVHYDFYRLEDPGLMSEELSETLLDPHTITVVEWAGGVTNLFPENTQHIQISLNDDGSRTISL